MQTLADFLKTNCPPDNFQQWVRESGVTTIAEAWDQLSNPDSMRWLLHATGKGDKEKLRLWACWCAKNTPLPNGVLISQYVIIPWGDLNAINTHERFALGQATATELEVACASANVATDPVFIAEHFSRNTALTVGAIVGYDILRQKAGATMSMPTLQQFIATGDLGPEGTVALRAAWKAQADALRRIMGNPFR